MERIGNPQVLLLEDHRRDGEGLKQLLKELEALQALGVVYEQARALDFFSDAKEPPNGIIVFMNSRERIGLYLRENFHLLATERYGVKALTTQLIGRSFVRRQMNQFLAKIAVQNHSSLAFDN